MFMFTIFTLPSDGELTDESDAEIIVSLCCLSCALELVMVAAGLTESLICVIIIMRQLTTGRLEGDKKLCVFQNRQSVDFTDVMGEIYFVAVHIIVAILQGISSSMV